MYSKNTVYLYIEIMYLKERKKVIMKKPGRNAVIAVVAVMSLILFTAWWKTGAEDAYYEKY